MHTRLTLRSALLTPALLASALTMLWLVEPLSADPGIGAWLSGASSPRPAMSEVPSVPGRVLDALLGPDACHLALLTDGVGERGLWIAARDDADSPWSSPRHVGALPLHGTVAWHPSGALVVEDTRTRAADDLAPVPILRLPHASHYERHGWKEAFTEGGDVGVRDLLTGETWVHARDGEQRSPALDKGARHLAWLDRGTRLVVRDLAAGEQWSVAWGEPGTLGPPAFAGQALVYQHATAEGLQLHGSPLGVELEAPEVWVDGVVRSDRPPAVSANQRWIAAPRTDGSVSWSGPMAGGGSRSTRACTTWCRLIWPRATACISRWSVAAPPPGRCGCSRPTSLRTAWSRPG